MGERLWCKHYRAMSEHDTCDANVPYETLKGIAFANRPCFYRGEGVITCDFAVYPTAEEIAAEELEMNKRIESLGIARAAIVAHLGGPWKRGAPGGQGVIDCPVCGAEKSLRFSRAGCNGHIHAACKTKDCVSWME